MELEFTVQTLSLHIAESKKLVFLFLKGGQWKFLWLLTLLVLSIYIDHFF